MTTLNEIIRELQEQIKKDTRAFPYRYFLGWFAERSKWIRGLSFFKSPRAKAAEDFIKELDALAVQPELEPQQLAAKKEKFFTALSNYARKLPRYSRYLSSLVKYLRSKSRESMEDLGLSKVDAALTAFKRDVGGKITPLAVAAAAAPPRPVPQAAVAAAAAAPLPPTPVAPQAAPRSVPAPAAESKGLQLGLSLAVQYAIRDLGLSKLPTTEEMIKHPDLFTITSRGEGHFTFDFVVDEGKWINRLSQTIPSDEALRKALTKGYIHTDTTYTHLDTNKAKLQLFADDDLWWLFSRGVLYTESSARALQGAEKGPSDQYVLVYKLHGEEVQISATFPQDASGSRDILKGSAETMEAFVHRLQQEGHVIYDPQGILASWSKLSDVLFDAFNLAGLVCEDAQSVEKELQEKRGQFVIAKSPTHERSLAFYYYDVGGMLRHFDPPDLSDAALRKIIAEGFTGADRRQYTYAHPNTIEGKAALNDPVVWNLFKEGYLFTDPAEVAALERAQDCKFPKNHVMLKLSPRGWSLVVASAGPDQDVPTRWKLSELTDSAKQDPKKGHIYYDDSGKLIALELRGFVTSHGVGKYLMCPAGGRKSKHDLLTWLDESLSPHGRLPAKREREAPSSLPDLLIAICDVLEKKNLVEGFAAVALVWDADKVNNFKRLYNMLEEALRDKQLQSTDLNRLSGLLTQFLDDLTGADQKNLVAHLLDSRIHHFARPVKTLDIQQAEAAQSLKQLQEYLSAAQKLLPKPAPASEPAMHGAKL